jgi:CBS domain-containing protein
LGHHGGGWTFLCSDSGIPTDQRPNHIREEVPEMATLAREVMTPDPACCTVNTTLDDVAKLMLQNDCGEIPVVDAADRIIGVVTDRDIVCRVIAEGKNPMAYTVDTCMTQPAVAVRSDAPLEEVVATMEDHQIRRVPVVDERGCCAGIISQADLATRGPEHEVVELVREVSRGIRA